MGSKPNKPSSNKETVQSSRKGTNRKLVTIPIHGVSFSYLLKTFNFTQEEDFNVVCQQVKELTRDFKDQDRSFANYLKSNTKTSQYVKEKADVFVSYAWLGSWVETMEALKYHFRQKKLEDIFIWMDFVCVDQHKNNELDFKDWSRVFQTSLEQIGKAVIAVVPAENPIVPTRAWCCFEMTQMVQANIPYDICISPNDTKKLIKDMQNGMGIANWNTLFSLINVEKSIATKSSDQEAILKLMKDIGIVQVNNVVLNALKRLYVGVASDAEKQAEEKSLVYVLGTKSNLHQALGELSEALTFSRRALKTAQSIPENEEQIAAVLNNLALLLYNQGKYDEARPLYDQSLAIRKKVLGDQHPGVAQLLNNLAGLLRDQGKFEEAEKYVQESLSINLKVLGEDHPSTITNYAWIGDLLQAQAKYEQAVPVLQKVVDAFKRVLGEDHPNTASALNNLALLLSDQGKFEESEKLQREAMAIRLKALGPEHPLYASDLNNLALLLQAQGKFAEAEPLLQQSLAIRKKALGADHPDVAQSLNNLAVLLRDQGMLHEAEPLYRQCNDIQLKVLGQDHPQYAAGLNNLAGLLRDQGNKLEARKLGKQAYAIASKSLGKDHPDTIKYKYWETF